MKLSRTGILLRVGLVFAMFFHLAKAETAPEWSWPGGTVPRTPTHSLAYGAGRWAGVGDTGKILSSADGVSWSVTVPVTDRNLHSVLFDGSRFVACGDHGTVLVSADGLIWEHRDAGTDMDLQRIAYGAGVYVLSGNRDGTGDSPQLFTSADLLTWSVFDTNGHYAGDVPTGSALGFGDGRFLLFLTNGQGVTSTDGYHWSEEKSDLDQGFPEALTYDSGRWYSLDHFSYLSWSADRIHWTSLPLPTGIYKVSTNLLVDGTRMMVSGSQGLYTSTDTGATWTWHGLQGDIPGVYQYYFDAVAKSNGRYLAAAYDGSVIGSTTFSWSDVYTIPAISDFSGVACGGGNFVVVGSTVISGGYAGIIRSSTDGQIWTTRWSAPGQLLGVGYGNGTWVAIGEAAGSNGSMILTSSNLTQWTKRNNPTQYNLHSITWANGLFVAVGGQYEIPVILTSPDGITWTARSSDARGPLNDVIYANGRFVAVGSWNSSNAGEIVSSADGIAWQRSSFEAAKGLACISYGNSQFLATGAYGYLLRSEDGQDWSTLDTADYPLWLSGATKLAFDGSHFIGVQSDFGGGASFSNDGKTWAQQFLGAPGAKAIVVGNGKVMVAGAKNMIVTRPVAELPAGPAVIAGSGSYVSWQALEGALGYRLTYRQPGTVRWIGAGDYSPLTTKAYIPDLSPGATYEFGLQAMTSTGLSSVSEIQQAASSGLDQWRVRYFGNLDATGDAADNANPDGDLFPNLIEYALGGNPLSGSGPLLFQQDVTVSSPLALPQATVSIMFHCDSRRADINLYVEFSADLVHWTRIAQSTAGGRAMAVSGQTGVTVSDPYTGAGSPTERDVLVSKTVDPAPGELLLPQTFVRFGVEKN